jgi:hypothetical protein
MHPPLVMCGDARRCPPMHGRCTGDARGRALTRLKNFSAGFSDGERAVWTDAFVLR